MIGESPRNGATVDHWINGKAETATSGRSGEVFNPATGEVVARAGFAGIEDVDRAVAAATAAFDSGVPRRFLAAPKSCSVFAS